jgi:hypothetical protein
MKKMLEKEDFKSQRQAELVGANPEKQKIFQNPLAGKRGLLSTSLHK